jgi:hypothetical protein
MSESKLIKLLNNDPNFFYYNGNNSGGTGNFTQKKIKYGEDRPGSSNSGQPYITTAIPNRSAFVATTDDGFIRGGMTTATRSSLIDKERISRFLKDKPKGPLFIQRQIGLQFSNPKLEVKKYPSGGTGLAGGALSLIASTFNVINELVPGPTRLYNNGFNTLAQIGANAFGQHFNRHGLTPVQDDNSKYLAVAKFNNENGSNRLVGLKDKLLKENSLDNILSSRFLNSVNFIVGNVNALLGTNIGTIGLQAPELTIDNYLGGPGSLYGRGRTLIRRFDITNGGTNKYSPIDSVDTSRIQTLSRLYNSAPDPAVTDAIASFLRVPSLTIPPTRVDAPSVQTAIPYNRNIPAGANPYRSSTSPTARLYSDIKNAVERLKSFPSASVDATTGRAIGLDPKASEYRYYGKRRVSGSVAIYNNTTQFERIDANILTTDFYIINPFDQVEDLVRFSAYIKGFKNDFNATWNEYNYVGRSESFYTYGKFKSNVSFTLDIPCFNKEQLLEKHRALGQLASTTAGAYNNNQLLGGVLLKVKIGNYLNNEYAILDSISYDIPDDSSWDISEKLAMYLKVNISLAIIYKDLPQYKKNEGFFKQLRDINPTFLNPNYKTVLASQLPR